MKKLIIIGLLVCISLSGCNFDEEEISPSVNDEEKENIVRDIKNPIHKPETLYSSSSIWNQKISANPKLDEKSDQMKKIMMHVGNKEGGFLLATKEWVMPVYFADENSPRYDVPLVAEWAPTKKMVMKNVPIPEWALEDPALGDEVINPFIDREESTLGDASLVIIDTSTNPWTEYDFWQARQMKDGKRVTSQLDRKNASWIASWGSKSTLDSDGIFDCGLSSRGSGVSYLGGMIWPEELEKGEINHKLAFSFPYNHVDGPVPPFTENDGWISEEEINNEVPNTYPIPEGAVVQLDPSVNLDAFEITDPETKETRKLNKHERTIAKAMQEYGMINIDNAGALQLYAINQVSFEKNPYAFADESEGYVYLPTELLNHTQVLKLGTLLETPETFLTKERWADYECNSKECNPEEWEICGYQENEE